MFSLVIILAFGLNVHNDFLFFDADTYHSPHDTGSIEEFADSPLPQPAILRVSEDMRNAARQKSKTNNPTLNRTPAMSVRYDIDTMTVIKESGQLDIKKEIQFKLRI
jgi:hypothetical protein